MTTDLNRATPSSEAQGNVAVEPVADTLTAALVILARYNIPPDVQELLVAGNPMRNVPPGALASSIASLSERLAEATAQRDRFCDKYLAALKRAEAAEAKLAEAQAAAFEEAAQIAENLSNSEHIAFDIREGNFPEQSDVRTAIAAAIRARAFRDATSGAKS